MKIFQISSEVNVGSVGRIAEQIGEQVIAQGWESYIAYGRENRPSSSKTIKIGDKVDLIKHGLLTRLTDRHGFGSKKATVELINKIRLIKPNLIQMQHLHGYYINIEILFNFLAEIKIPVVWTFHDCWSFTGHCAYYEFIDCQKWLTQCHHCPQKNEYPESLLLDNSEQNYKLKNKLFNSVEDLTIVPVSNWLGGETRKSFLGEQKIHVIQNGIDLEQFAIQRNSDEIKKEYKIEDKFLILGVASPWTKRKGLQYFIELAERIDNKHQIILVGLDDNQIKTLPNNIIGIKRTQNVSELAKFYSAADVFINPTLEDTFPTTNLESLACGTPVITFNSGGSPEAIDDYTGLVVAKGNVDGLVSAISKVKQNGKLYYQEKCRARAEINFDKKKNFAEYIDLYKSLMNI